MITGERARAQIGSKARAMQIADMSERTRLRSHPHLSAAPLMASELRESADSNRLFGRALARNGTDLHREKGGSLRKAARVQHASAPALSRA
eukprot:5142115-Pleurochrysis_carterae.AAC.2